MSNLRKNIFSKSYLENHCNAAHKKLKPFTCQICGNTFCQNGSLKKHVASVYKNLRPFECKNCSKSFTTTNKLKKHDEPVHKKIKNP